MQQCVLSFLEKIPKDRLSIDRTYATLHYNWTPEMLKAIQTGFLTIKMFFSRNFLPIFPPTSASVYLVEF